jgi:iron complex outermembrane receptor protein
VRQQNVAGDLRWTRDDDSVVLRLGMDRQDLRLPGALTEAQIAADPRQAASPDDFSLKDGGFATLAGSMRLDAFTLAADLGYRDTRAAAFFKDNAFGLFDAYIETRLARVVFSPRVRWQGELFGASQNVVVGYDWSDWDWDRRTAANAAALGSPTAETTSAQTNGALYAQWFGDVAPRLRANLGWREQRTETELRTLIPAPQTMQQQVLGLSAGEAGLRFAVTEPTALLARVTKSFRVATVEENGFTLTGRLLQPQTAIGYDAGVEHRAPGRMLRAVGYQIDLENEIYFSPLSGTFGVNMNLPPTRRRGIELAASAQAASSLELGGSVIVQQARFREGVFNGVDVAGNDIPLVPRVLANLRATWEFVPRARLGANYTFVGRQRYDNDQANRFREMPTYGLFDLKASYEVQGFTLAATIANLFDVAYYNYGIVNSATNPTTFNAYPQAGRTYFASIEYRFR